MDTNANLPMESKNSNVIPMKMPTKRSHAHLTGKKGTVPMGLGAIFHILSSKRNRVNQ